MIRPERLTVKAAEALQQAGALARTRGNPVLNDAHLFHALLSQDDGILRLTSRGVMLSNEVFQEFLTQ